ncbi:MAG: hypothetical protein NVS3B19_20940 [Ginsengibacter sp.]
MVLKEVAGVREKIPRLGVIKLHWVLGDTLRDHGIKMGRDKMYRLLGDYGLLIPKRSRRHPITTNSNHPFYKYKNLIKEMTLIRPNQLWVSDITYLKVSGQFCYLSLITDAFSRKIVGYHVAPNLKTEGPLRALKMALSSYGNDDQQSLIHHSDRGLQYCCGEYIKTLSSHQIQISMTQNGDPYENALAERMNGILKYDFNLRKTFKTIEGLRLAVDDAVGYYNSLRPHLSLKMSTPDAVHSG